MMIRSGCSTTTWCGWHKQTAKHRVAEIRLPPPRPRPTATAFFKCIEQRGLVAALAGAHFAGRPSADAGNWDMRCLRRGIDTPRPILFVERPADQVPQILPVDGGGSGERRHANILRTTGGPE